MPEFDPKTTIKPVQKERILQTNVQRILSQYPGVTYKRIDKHEGVVTVIIKSTQYFATMLWTDSGLMRGGNRTALRLLRLIPEFLKDYPPCLNTVLQKTGCNALTNPYQETPHIVSFDQPVRNPTAQEIIAADVLNCTWPPHKPPPRLAFSHLCNVKYWKNCYTTDQLRVLAIVINGELKERGYPTYESVEDTTPQIEKTDTNTTPYYENFV